MDRKIVIVLLCLIAFATSKLTIYASEIETEVTSEVTSEVETTETVATSEAEDIVNQTSSGGMSEEAIVMLAAETAVETISDIYDEGTLNATYTTYFRDCMSRVGFNDHYIYYRSGQYQYTFMYGDITLSGTTFSIVTANRITITTASGYNSNLSYDSDTVSNASINVGSNIVYSDLGQYPMLEGRSEVLEYVQTFTLVVACFVCLLRVGLFSSRR